MKTIVILITDIFPFYPGEAFLETEIRYWAKNEDFNFVIMPKNKTNNLRKIPSEISIDYTLLNKPIETSNKKNMVIQILRSNIFYKEIYSNKIMDLRKIKHLFVACRDFLHYRSIFKSYLNENKDKKIIFYSYWHTAVCYALQSLKNEFNNIQVISRIHGYDLYKERRIYNYMPLKTQFLDNIDKIYAISDKGKEYLIDTYNCNPKVLEVARLAVMDLKITTLPTEVNKLHIVSCSNIVEVKRIDKIIDSLILLSQRKNDLNIIWTHIGDGIKRKELELYAYSKLNTLDNITYKFLGQLHNNDVLEFYRYNKVDIFLNVSEFEGVPVSIMEALSCHIPIVAPDIGGISEMVLDGINGCLLSKKTTIVEIVDSLSKINLFKNNKIRNAAYQVFLQKYNAETNYKFFIKQLKIIGDCIPI